MASTAPAEGVHTTDHQPASTEVAGGRGEDSFDNQDNSAFDNASSVDDHVAEKTPHEEAKRYGYKGIFAEHFQRFWWIYIIGLIILLAILLPIVFKVVVPALVRAIVASQSLPIMGGAIYFDDPNHVSLSINTSLSTPIPATVDVLDLNLYYDDTYVQPWTNITFPRIDISKNTTSFFQNKTSTIQNMTSATKFLSDYYSLPEVMLPVRATPNVHVILSGPLDYHPDISKNVTLRSLNAFEGKALTSLVVMLPPQNGHNIKGTINLPNNGILTLGLGNVTLTLSTGGVDIGQLYLYDVTLQLGNNTVDYVGHLNFSSLLPNIGTILVAEGGALDRGVLDLNTTITMIENQGQRITYLEQALNDKVLTFNIGIITLLADLIQGLLGGTGQGLTSALGEIFGNSTFLQGILDNFQNTPSGTTQLDQLGNGNITADIDYYTQRKHRRRAEQAAAATWQMWKWKLKAQRESW